MATNKKHSEDAVNTHLDRMPIFSLSWREVAAATIEDAVCELDNQYKSTRHMMILECEPWLEREDWVRVYVATWEPKGAIYYV